MLKFVFIIGEIGSEAGRHFESLSITYVKILYARSSNQSSSEWWKLYINGSHIPSKKLKMYSSEQHQILCL